MFRSIIVFTVLSEYESPWRAHAPQCNRDQGYMSNHVYFLEFACLSAENPTLCWKAREFKALDERALTHEEGRAEPWLVSRSIRERELYWPFPALCRLKLRIAHIPPCCRYLSCSRYLEG